MPRSATRCLAVLALGVATLGAGVPGALAEEAPSTSTGPVVTWHTPAPTTFPAYANITLTVDATEVGGTIANVMSGTQVAITAGTAPSGQWFQHWTGPVANTFSPSTPVVTRRATSAT